MVCFFKVINLDFIGEAGSHNKEYVKDVDADLLTEGIFIDIQGIVGQPIRKGNTNDIVDPLTNETYTVTFTGLNGYAKKSEICIKNKYAKVWFDGNI